MEKKTSFDLANRLLSERVVLEEAEMDKVQVSSKPKSKKCMKDEEEGPEEVREKKHFKAIKKLTVKLIEWAEKKKEGAALNALTKILDIVNEELGEHEEEKEEE